MGGVKPKICAAIVNDDLVSIKKVESLVDMYEVRIDLIGRGWANLARRLKRPWIACNRRLEEGGSWRGSEEEKTGELKKAVELGASIIDIELATPGVEKVVREIKGRVECLVSYHNIKETPPLEKMREIIRNELNAGADICKVVTTARSFADNINVLKLVRDFPDAKVVSFAMEPLGQISRILCPLAGGYFTYASIEAGRESAAGQITVADLIKIYGMVQAK